MTLAEIARVAQGANAALDATIGIIHPTWEEMPEWRKEGYIQGVRDALANPGGTPEEHHEAWMQHKLKTGWVYGPVKDVEKRTHPSLVPFEELSEIEKIKDTLYQSIVWGLAPFLTEK